jgi:hypothetical protein
MNSASPLYSLPHLNPRRVAAQKIRRRILYRPHLGPVI